MVAKYRKKPVEVEAFRFYVDPMPDWFMDKVTSNEIVIHDSNYRTDGNFAYCIIKTLEGEMKANAGDHIIKGTMNEVYPCKHSIFEEIYSTVSNMDSYECPNCKSEETYCVNDFMERAVEYRKCEDCDCNYEVQYEMTVKDIKIIPSRV